MVLLSGRRREPQELEQGLSRGFALAVPNLVPRLCPPHSSRFQVGGVSVQIAGERSADVTFGRSLEPFRVPSVSDIDIQVEWFPPSC